jgi:hypothetical protein
MADTRKAILLRISPELWAGLNRWAAAELRSLNAQIEYVLREAVRKRGARVDEAGEGQALPPGGTGEDGSSNSQSGADEARD